MVDSTAACDRGRAWPSRSRTQGAALGGAKGKPEDEDVRRRPKVPPPRVLAGSASDFDHPRGGWMSDAQAGGTFGRAATRVIRVWGVVESTI